MTKLLLVHLVDDVPRASRPYGFPLRPRAHLLGLLPVMLVDWEHGRDFHHSIPRFRMGTMVAIFCFKKGGGNISDSPMPSLAMYFVLFSPPIRTLLSL